MSEQQKQTETDQWTDEPTGDGGSLGTPSADLDERSPSSEQEHHGVVSGGGVVEREELEPPVSGASMTDLD